MAYRHALILLWLLLATSAFGQMVLNPYRYASAVTPVSVTYTDENFVSASTTDPITFTGESTGTAAATRISVVALLIDGRPTLTGVTINGITATRATSSNLTNHRCEIWYAPNPTGTTGNVVVTFGNTTSASVAAITYSVVGASGAPSDTDAASGATVASLSLTGLTIPANGAAVIGGTNQVQGTAVTWTGATESTDFAAGSMRASGATTTTAGTPTITLDGPTDDHVMAGAAWGPSGSTAFAYSDDFNRADSDSLGANWTELSGDTDISSNTALSITGGFTDNLYVYNSTVDPGTQYQKFTWSYFGGTTI